MGKHAEAEPLYRRTLKGFEEMHAMHRKFKWCAKYAAGMK